jgi:hypothetical protein
MKEKAVGPEQRGVLEQRRSEIGVLLLEHMKRHPDELVKGILDYCGEIRSQLDTCHLLLMEVKRGMEEGTIIINDSDLKNHLSQIFL